MLLRPLYPALMALCLAWPIIAGTVEEVWAAPARVTLLTSIRDSEIHLESMAEEMFRKRFQGTDLEVRVVHRATLSSIRAELLDRDTVAAFYFAHSAQEQKVALAGAVAEGKIADFRGYDVKDAFQNVHPGLRYLAVIGCQSSGIFERFRSLGVYADRPDLKIRGFEGKILASRTLFHWFLEHPILEAIHDGLDQFAEPLDASDLHAACPDREEQRKELCEHQAARRRTIRKSRTNLDVARGVTPLQPVVWVTRRIPHGALEEQVLPVFVQVNGVNLTFFEKTEPGSFEVREVPVESIQGKRITIESGAGYARKKNETILGDFQICSQETCWRPLSSQQGVPLGVGRNVYVPEAVTRR